MATLVAWVSATIFAVAFSGFIFGKDFLGAADYLRPPDELFALMPIGRLGHLGTVICYGLILRYLVKEVSLRSGLLLGTALGASIFSGATLGMYSLVPWPPKMLLAWGSQGVVNAILVCAIFGAMCHPQVRSHNPNP